MTPEQPSDINTKKINHSNEKPINEFDNTSLEQAIEQDLVTTSAPEKTSDLPTGWIPDQGKPISETHEKRSHKGLVIGAISGLAGVALAGGAYFLVNANHSAPGHQTTTSAGPTPEASATPEATKGPEIQQESVPLSVEKYPTAETLAPAFFQEETNWYNADGTTKNAEEWINSNDRGTYFNQLLEKSDSQYISNLMTDNQQKNEALLAYISRQQVAHHDALMLNFQTAPGNDAADIKPYARQTLVDSVKTVSQDSQKIVAEVTTHEEDNSSENRAVELSQGASINTSPVTVTYTWVNEGGSWKLTNISS